MRKLFIVKTLLFPIWLYSQTGAEHVVVQNANRRSFTLSGGFQVAIPKGEFAENYDGNLFGMYASLSIPLLDLPIEVGGGFIWNSLSNESRGVEIVNNLVPDRDEGDLYVRGNSYTYRLQGRLRPLNGRFRPYGELFAGVRNFRITSELELEDFNQASGDLIESDLTFTAGYAIGAKFQLIPTLFLEFRFDNQSGSEATYIDPASVTIRDDGSFTYETRSSQTNQWAISAGVAFSF